jgi:protein-tyrosine phosphatase
VGAALVLTALGVPYETVRADFVLSNDAPGLKSLTGQMPAAMHAIPPEVLRVLGGVDGSWLDAAFDQIARDYGSVEGFLDRELGVGPREIAALRKRMLN